SNLLTLAWHVLMTQSNYHVVEQILGQGSFGTVAKCRNTESNNTVAVKVIRGKEDFVQSAMEEIDILTRLRCLDSETCNIVQWNGFFFDKENICTVFELLDQSLHEYVQEQDKWAVSHLHSIGFVHMDLKPHNIMVVDRHQLPLKVKLIDFGLARPVSALKQGDCMGTMCYCAPEMLLGVPFNESIDMWALGLTMTELAMGCALYPGDAEYDVLRFVVETQGQPPDDVLDSGLYTQTYFYTQKHGTSRWRFMTPEDVYYEHGYSEAMEKDTEHQNDQKLFVSLIKSMLILDASNRIKAREVLEHQFFAPSHIQEQGRDPNPQQAATLREKYEDPNVSETEDFTIQISHMEDGVLCPTRSLTATSQEPLLGVDFKTEAKTKTKKKSWLRCIMRRVSKAFHRCFS
uniref:Homeodomain-interacting protein kinase 1-like n=1 Tax=Stegastes partitus TaxID=144197 RepID=A0A3B4Z7T4_9TELE